MSTKVKEGDLITIEKVKKDYRSCNDFSIIRIPIEDDLDQSFGDIRKLRNRNIYKVVHTDLHRELASFGVNVGHYTLEGIEIEGIAFKDDHLLVNGEFKIMDTPGQDVLLKDRYFLSEQTAQDVATSLNEVELEKMMALGEAVEKATAMLQKIVKKEFV
jgi:hypothetical protein